MSPKRQNTRQSSSSLSGDDRPTKRRRSSPDTRDDEFDANKSVKVFILQAKLEPETISELYKLIERQNETSNWSDSGGTDNLNLDVCSDVLEADIIITAVRMRKRLERHINWKDAQQKAIVTPDWLRETVTQGHLVACEKFAALSELHDETVDNCPDCGEGCVQHAKSRSRHQEYVDASPNPQAPGGTHDTTSAKVKVNWSGKYACMRASPLVCVNQNLVDELQTLCRQRELEGLPINALGYERAIAVIKSYPTLITQVEFETEVTKLPHLGNKITSKIQEFLDFGHIKESRAIRESERFQSLSAFTSVYGVGPSTARHLYDVGLRNIEDMERYCDVTPGTTIRELEAELVTPNGRKIARNDKLPDLSLKVALALRLELNVPIPKEEVEEMHAIVMKELDIIQPGCISTIVGGYRRGKSQSNDVDIVISHRDMEYGSDEIKDLCKKFTAHLYLKGLVTNVMHLSGFHAPNRLRTEHWDSLEKALTVFILPSDGKQQRIHRRLDLIFATPESYWTAVLGWSGSRMFERDIRLWAKVEKGMKFDSSGLTRRHDSKLFVPKSEKDIFNILGLEWVDPIMRNANA